MGDSQPRTQATSGTSSSGHSSAWDEVPVSLTDEQRALMQRHLDLVVERNRTMNLTRITDADEAVFLHILDSLLLKNAFDAAPAGPFVDIGTGAGYPGIPLAIACGRRGTLVDSVKKKAKAVSEFVEALGLSGRLRVSDERIEDLARRERGRYAVATARAVAPAAVLVEYAAPLLMGGGRLVLAKARPSDEEVSQAVRAAEVCGMEIVSRETFELPRELGQREVLSFVRCGKPRIRLPRQVGQARNHPLGQVPGH